MKKVIAICLILLSLSIVPVSARAGGGSSGGSSGGGSGSSSHHASSDSFSSPIVECIGLSLVMISFYYIRYSQNYAMHRRIQKPLKEACHKDDFWNESELKKKVTEAYYEIQEAWSQQDFENLKKYLSEELYLEWEIKINWQIYRHERNVLKDIYLISNKIVSICDDEDNENDYFWVAIVGRMEDSMICDNEIQSVSRDAFVEYWKFKRKGDMILLDQILQEDEFNGGVHEDC